MKERRETSLQECGKSVAGVLIWAGMEFRILGPLEVEVEGQQVPLGGLKQRALVAVLLLHPNEVVSRDRLIDALWGERAPASAQRSLDSYVSRLRGLLGPQRLVRRQPGLLLVV